MYRLIGATLFALGFSIPLAAAGAVTAPEIDVAAGISAVVLLAGAVVVLRGRRRKPQGRQAR